MADVISEERKQQVRRIHNSVTENLSSVTENTRETVTTNTPTTVTKTPSQKNKPLFP
jgi:hypothetical protein